MRILFGSDLHLDFVGHDTKLILPSDDQFDILVIAGDVSNAPWLALNYVITIQKKTKNPVILVPGNHEYYGTKIVETNEALKSFTGTLRREILEIGDERFVGFTNWYKPSDGYHEINDWNDYIHIRDSIDGIRLEHEYDMQFIQENLRKDDIVISHMLPCFDVVAPKYTGSVTNKFFVNDLSTLIKERSPKLWIFGHTHIFRYAKFDNGTHIVGNPRGYPYENERFSFLIFDTKKMELRMPE